MNPPGTNHAQATTTSNNNPTGAATHRIRLVPPQALGAPCASTPSAATSAMVIPSSVLCASLTVLVLDSPPSILSIPTNLRLDLKSSPVPMLRSGSGRAVNSIYVCQIVQWDVFELCEVECGEYEEQAVPDQGRFAVGGRSSRWIIRERRRISIRA
ncbi:hypothetical protein P691DRAFT_804758 [Macrolepiota fuliginosa MF-IS2]|uniref:Uncharacterized protein n=1 Tax=Macrolepiota fuliginosa MF-IS2 TaxID=1400762 RepID=A0A9P6BUX5_9AGAR|nr:hypothetical protein P691DRAFT_804758 [Macrolepiota fuliginosa MF-IS2]